MTLGRGATVNEPKMIMRSVRQEIWQFKGLLARFARRGGGLQHGEIREEIIRKNTGYVGL